MLDNRETTVTGVIIHILSPIFPLVAPLMAYAISDNQFTKNNAMNISNWQITASILFVVGLISAFLGSDDLMVNGDQVEWAPILPEPIATVTAIGGVGLLFATITLSLVVYPIYGFITAILGQEKQYPGSYTFID